MLYINFKWINCEKQIIKIKFICHAGIWSRDLRIQSQVIHWTTATVKSTSVLEYVNVLCIILPLMMDTKKQHNLAPHNYQTQIKISFEADNY